MISGTQIRQCKLCDTITTLCYYWYTQFFYLKHKAQTDNFKEIFGRNTDINVRTVDLRF